MEFEDLKNLYLKKKEQFSAETYKHISELLKEAKEMYRVLKPGKYMHGLLETKQRRKNLYQQDLKYILFLRNTSNLLILSA